MSMLKADFDSDVPKLAGNSHKHLPILALIQFSYPTRNGY